MVKEVIQNSTFISFKDFEKDIKLTKSINFVSQKKQGVMLNNELVNDYKTFCKNVCDNLERHTNSTSVIDRNYKITKQDNIPMILEILKVEAQRSKCCIALNTLGFLHYHGIEVNQSHSLAFEYFKSSARNGNKEANFVCYCMEEKTRDKFKYLCHGLFHKYSKSYGALGVLLKKQQIPEEAKQQITAFLNKEAAEKNVPVALRNFGIYLEYGNGVK